MVASTWKYPVVRLLSFLTGVMAIPTKIRKILEAGNIPVTITDADGCTVSDEIEVSVGLLGIQMNEINPQVDDGTLGSVSITITGGVPPIFSYLDIEFSGRLYWEDPSDLEAGNY